MTYPCGEYDRTINTADNSSDNDISDSEHLSYVPFKRQAMTNYDSGNTDDLFILRASPSSPSTFDADGSCVSETYGEWGDSSPAHQYGAFPSVLLTSLFNLYGDIAEIPLLITATNMVSNSWGEHFLIRRQL